VTEKSGLSANDHKPRIIPLFLVITGDDEEFTAFERFQGMVEGFYQFDFLGVVDALESNFDLAISGGLEIYLTAVEWDLLAGLRVEINLSRLHHPVVLPTEMSKLLAPLGVEFLEILTVGRCAICAPSQLKAEFQVAGHRCRRKHQPHYQEAPQTEAPQSDHPKMFHQDFNRRIKAFTRTVANTLMRYWIQ